MSHDVMPHASVTYDVVKVVAGRCCIVTSSRSCRNTQRPWPRHGCTSPGVACKGENAYPCGATHTAPAACLLRLVICRSPAEQLLMLWGLDCHAAADSK